MFAENRYKGQSVEFPKHDIDPKLKLKPEWCKEFCEAIYSLWLRDKTGIQYSRRSEMELHRLYADGNQPVEKYMDRLFPLDPKANTRKGYMNLSWDILSVAPKVRAIVIGMMEKIDHEIQCTAIDPNSQKEKDAIKWGLWAEKELEGTFGKHGFEGDQDPIRQIMPEIPKSIEEIEMFMQTGITKLKQEIGMENAIDLSLYESEWKQIKKMLYEDLFDLGMCFVKDYVDPVTGKPMSRYVDPANYITKFSRHHNFPDNLYGAEIRYVTIAQLRKEMAKEIASGEVTEDDFRKIASDYASHNDNPQSYNFEYYGYHPGNSGFRYDEFKITILDAEWLSYDVKKYETRTNKRGDKFVSKKGFEYDLNKRSENRKPGKSEMPMVYKAKWIVGTKWVFDYGHQTDIPRLSKNKARLSFHGFKLTNKSMLSSIIPLIDNMQITWLKMQNALAMAAPSGLAIEFGALNNLNLGNGKMKPLDVLSIRRQTGDLIFKAGNHHPSPNPSPNSGKPVFPLEGGVGNQLQEFVKTLNHDSSMIRDITGVNEAIDASMPNPEMPVKTTQIAVSAANHALSGFFFAYQSVKESAAKNMALRWQIVSRYNDLEGYYPALGKSGMNAIKITSDISYAEYAIKIEMRPSDDQRERVLMAARESLAASKQGGVGITMSDYFFIDRMVSSGGNLKYVQVYMAWREKQEGEKAQVERMQAQELQGRQAQELEAQKHQNFMEQNQAILEREVAVETAKSNLRSEESNNRHSNEMESKQVDKEAETEKVDAQGRNKIEEILNKSLVENLQTPVSEPQKQ